MTPDDALQHLYDEAMAIKARAEGRPSQMLTAAECQRLDEILDHIKGSGQLSEIDRLTKPQGRRTEPNPIGGAMAHITPSAGHHHHHDAERLVDRHGNELRVLASTDRLTDSIPRSERLPLSDLGALVYAQATGDFSRISDRCRSIMAQQGGQADSTGGVLIPSPLSAEVVDAIRDASVFMRSGARTVNMTSRTLDYGRVVSGPTPAWRAEHGVIAESPVVLDRVTLEAKNLGAMVRSSIELLDDAPASGLLLRNLLSTELGQEFDRAMLFGNGALEPMGVVTYASDSPQVVQVLPGIGALTDYLDFVEALGLLWDANTVPTAIMTSAKTRANLAALDTGNPQTAIRVPDVLQSIPWLMTPKLSIAGSPQESAAVIGDFSTCVVGMRQEVRISVHEAGGEYEEGSPGVVGDAFARNQLRIRATMRVDLVLHQPRRLVVLTGLQD